MRGTAETPDLILSGEIGVNKTVNTESLNIYENGDYTPPAGVDGYNDIHVDVRPVIDSITIRENGTYEASGEVDGYAPIVVNVPQSAAKVYAKNINANGNYYPDAGYDGFSQVSVNVPATPLRPLNVTENGEYNPPTGEGYSKVVVDVPTDPEIESITITANGTYTAPTGVDGYSPVIVNVPHPEDAYYIKDMTPGAIASFDDGADMVLPSLVASIVPVQAGSGDPSPTNVRPISGWTEEVVYVRGVNQWDEEWESGYYDGGGEPKPSDSTIRSKNYISVNPSTTYYIKSNVNLYICQYDINKTFIGTRTYYINQTFTTDSNAYFIRFNLGSAYGTTYNNDISINYPSTDTEYHAYAGTTATIPFTNSQGQSVEVFGGSDEVVSGALQVEKRGVYIGSLNFTKSQSGLFQTNELASILKKSSSSSEPTGYIISSHFREIDSSSITGPQGANPSPDGVMALSGAGMLYFNYTALTDVNDFKTAMADVMLVYELATPVTYQQQPTSIKSLDGDNNVFAITGDVLEGSYFSETPA